MSNWNKSGTQLLKAPRDDFYADMKAMLEGIGFVEQPNREFVYTYGEVEGRTVNAIVNLSISGRTSFEKKAPAVKEAVEKEVIDIAELLNQ